LLALKGVVGESEIDIHLSRDSCEGATVLPPIREDFAATAANCLLNVTELSTGLGGRPLSGQAIRSPQNGFQNRPNLRALQSIGIGDISSIQELSRRFRPRPKDHATIQLVY